MSTKIFVSVMDVTLFIYYEISRIRMVEISGYPFITMWITDIFFFNERKTFVSI